MRVTNSMTTNKSLVNINRNMRHMSRLHEQIQTTKIISRPSENPLIATRALRFRSQLAEIQQFQRNVESGHAWMNTTEASFFNLVGREDESVLIQIQDLLLEANSHQITPEDIKTNVLKVESLMRQIGLEMNQTIGGRYVFSGWRTDQPPILNRDMPGTFIITQQFNVNDVTPMLSFQRLVTPENPTGMPVSHQTNVLKLAYNNVTFTPDGFADVAGMPPLGIFGPDGTAFTIRTIQQNPEHADFNASSWAQAYTPPDDGNTIHFIPETGELIFGDRVAAAFQDGTQITYEISNLRAGELNPLVYFETWELGTPPRFFDPNDQLIHYEFHNDVTIPVNSLARNVYTDKFFADLKRLVEFTQYAIGSLPTRRELEEMYRAQGVSEEDLNGVVTKREVDEGDVLLSVLTDRITNMLRRLDYHSINVTREHTNLGNRMRRVQMFEIRLEQDEGNITRLKSENEDVDMSRALVEKAAGEAAYQSALRAIANIVQLSLVRFI